MAKKSQNLVLETLTNVQKSGELVEIYDDANNAESFLVGKVLQVDEQAETILLSTFDETCEWNGIVLIEIDDIIRVGVQSDYLHENLLPMQLLSEGKLLGYQSEPERGLDALPRFEQLDTKSVLQKTQKKHLFCELVFKLSENPRLYGYVEEVGDNTIAFRSFSRWGVDLGVDYLKIADVKSVRFFCHQALMRERFYLARTQQNT